MILITSIGEFILYYSHFFYLFHFTVKEKKRKKKTVLQDFFLCCLGVALFSSWSACSPEAGVISNINQMEHLEGEQYSQERNPRAYMSMRDYRSLPWQNQQPLGRNPNPNRSMRDYRDQWMSVLVYSFPSTYAPLASPHFASTPQPQQPTTSSPVEQAILNLSKLVDNFIEDQRAVNV